MDKFVFEVVNHEGHAQSLEAIYDPDFSDRNGADPDFLGIHLPLPVPSANVIDNVALNQTPGANGTLFLDYQHFSVMFNGSAKLPFMTAVNVNGKLNELAVRHPKRTSDTWFIDNRIGSDQDRLQFRNEDYRGSDFQKGHMVRYYDPAWGENATIKKKAIGDTFHYTNCCPQVKNLNTGSWFDLEEYAMARAIFQDEKITVYAGPIFNNAKKIERLLVPMHFWKILVYRKNDTLEAMGFILSHDYAFRQMMAEGLLVEKAENEFSEPTLTSDDIDRLFNKVNLKRWVVKIELIEKKTGLKFGLKDFDANSDKEEYFNSRVDHNPFTEEKERRMIELMELYRPSNFEECDDDVEFLRSI